MPAELDIVSVEDFGEEITECVTLLKLTTFEHRSPCERAHQLLVDADFPGSGDRCGVTCVSFRRDYQLPEESLIKAQQLFQLAKDNLIASMSEFTASKHRGLVCEAKGSLERMLKLLGYDAVRGEVRVPKVLVGQRA